MFYEFPLLKNHNKSAALASISNKANLINEHCEPREERQERPSNTLLNVVADFLGGRKPWFAEFASLCGVKPPLWPVVPRMWR